ncbi:MAG: cysteine desulfurase family protein [Acidimicrobiales bacterium]
MRHYLDHASISPLRPEAARAMRDWMEGPAADPGRVYHEARLVRNALEEARDAVAHLTGVRPRQVVFTSGGTEAVHTAVWAATRARPGAVVLTAGVEHSAVRDASARLAPVEPLAVDRSGRISLDDLGDALARHADDPLALVHCQWANHEVGTLQPVTDVVRRCREAGVPVHVDAVAAAGHVELDLGRLEADMVSISAHQMGGPPGVGALIIRRGVQIDPWLVGGQQERARRAGTENTPGIVGFGAAASALAEVAPDGGTRLLEFERSAARIRIRHLVDAALAVHDVAVVGDPDPAGRLPHLVCLGVAGVEAEPVVLGLDRAGVAVHSGSACASESLEPSPVLAAMGVDASHSLRLSVGWSTADADVEAFARSFPPVVASLRSLRS